MLTNKNEIIYIFLLVLLTLSKVSCNQYKFPENFQFGIATSAYQAEGASDDRGEIIWDRFQAIDGLNASDASKSYELYKDDIAIIKELGVDFYRFSISWSRILPNGDLSVINENALEHYDRMIDELLANGVEPMITIFHWELPQVIQDFGGWISPMAIDYFWDYATVVFNRFADRVKLWTTFNEPILFCEHVYKAGRFSQLVYAPGSPMNWCVHHVLLAHAKVYHMYHEHHPYSRGTISIVQSCEYYWPKDPYNEADHLAVNRMLQFACGWLYHPIFSKIGGYPMEMIEIVGKKLPQMDQESIDLIKGTSDYMALNYYTSAFAEFHSVSESNSIEYPFVRSVNSSWTRAKSDWLYSVPNGLRGLLKWLKNEYDNPRIIITENGFSDDGQLDDYNRIEYIKDHLNQILQSIYIDKTKVFGYTAWSLIDNFEWHVGYTERFGLYHVDFDDDQRRRTPKKSATFLRETIKQRYLN